MVALQAQALRNLCDFALVSEEKPKVEPCSEDSDDEQEQVTVAVAAGAGDTVTASGPIQRHWNRVLDCLFSSHQDVQQAALKVRICTACSSPGSTFLPNVPARLPPDIPWP